MKYLSLTIPGGTEINPVAGMPSGGASAVEGIIQWAVTVLLIAAVILTIIFLIWGGIQWITSAGDKAKIEAARKRLTYAIIGFVVILISFMIINIIGDLFGIKFFG